MNKIMSDDLKRGVFVFVLLAVLTGVEYILGVSQVPYILLWLVALIKGGLVLWFFMHVFRVFGSEGGH